MITTSVSEPREKNLFGTISQAALLAGLLDIAAAVIQFYIDTGEGPARLFKYIASGIFGQTGAAGGKLMITWGIVLHFMIVFLFTLLLFFVYPLLSSLIKNRFLAGFFYGLFIWVVMYQVVLPLSKAEPRPFDAVEAIVAMLILVTMIGIPLTWTADRYYMRKIRAA